MKTVLLLLACGITTLSARTWTNNQGKAIEAELVKVVGETVIIKLNGAEVPIKIETLSTADKEFVGQWVKGSGDQNPTAHKVQSAAGDALTLCGKPITKGGEMNLVELPLPKPAGKRDPKKEGKETMTKGVDTTLKLAVAVPADFNPAKPQKVFLVVTAVNNDAEKAQGNIGKFKMYRASCIEAGWVCIAVDSDVGDPNTFLPQQEAFNLLDKEWPGIKSSIFAAGGFSGGSKGCWAPVAWLVKNKYRVAGVFMGGCNQDYSEIFRKESSAPAGGYRLIHAYMSTGKDDKIASPAAAELVMKSLKSNGIRNARNELHDGGHSFYAPHFAEALRWFAEPETKK